MKIYTYDDGGRLSAGFKGTANDCVTRAIAIASQRPYKEVYNEVNRIARNERRKRNRSSARSGVHKVTTRKILKELGWVWTPTMGVGTGCKVHLIKSELPHGRVIVQLSQHVCAVVNGVVHDTHDPTREGTRCVYGFWEKDKNQDKKEER